MDFYALKLFQKQKQKTKTKKNYWKIFIHVYLMYRISDDHEMSMNKALVEVNI